MMCLSILALNEENELNEVCLIKYEGVQRGVTEIGLIYKEFFKHSSVIQLKYFSHGQFSTFDQPHCIQTKFL